MRGLKRNQKSLYYQLYSEHIPVYETDLDGNIIYDPVTGEPLRTGDYTVGYADPVEFRARVSAARGEASTDPFGVNTEYDKTISDCSMKLPIDELSVLYVDKKPEFDSDGNLMNKPDYKVVKVAGDINSTLYAIKQLPDGGAKNG
ncbi:MULTISPECIES: hypothetical protein [Bacillota]|uniref:Uncharacterized protein n=1 Tax=[Clostridium] celerecrescens 18A TaxID=1286362 RepID=A0A2M8Z320_9FIRM|nr:MULTISPECIES: hypothetical protein [Bacillota]EIW27735.1 hypothetical protein FA11_4718 [Pelosinus fermentans A11]PJJ27831.1 hypothetical protein H171_1311 [[Clostridium] celerecrescens 18A]